MENINNSLISSFPIISFVVTAKGDKCSQSVGQLDYLRGLMLLLAKPAENASAQRYPRPSEGSAAVLSKTFSSSNLTSRFCGFSCIFTYFTRREKISSFKPKKPNCQRLRVSRM